MKGIWREDDSLGERVMVQSDETIQIEDGL